MRRIIGAALVAGVLGLSAPLDAGERIKAVVVTGGHAFNQKAFFPLFEGHEDIQYVHAPQKDHSEIFEDISHWPYDVIVLYHMTQRISETRRQNFLKLLDRGVGVVALHHCICAFQDWPEYRSIIGGKFYMRETVENGVKHHKSGARGGERMKIRVADKTHPITRGLADFEVLDETYCRQYIHPKVRILLTTDNPTSDKAVAWAHTCRKARVFFVQMGHGTSIYAQEPYRRLVAQAIRWAAGRLREK